MANLYDKAGLVNIPVGYQDGFLYNIKPTDNTLGFRFNRDSAATLVNSKGLIEQVGYFGPELVQNGDFEQIGSELVVNGDFATDSDWVKGTGTTISGGNANFVNATGVSLYQNIGTQSGTVKVEFTVTNYTSGTLNVYSGSNQSVGVVNVSANALGTYTVYVDRNGGNVNIIFGSSDNFTGSIDNVSVKEVGQNWTQTGANWSFGNNKAIADGTSQGSLYQSISTVAVGSKYKINYTISDYVSGNIRFYLGGVFTNYVTSNGIHSETITATSTDAVFQTSIQTPFTGSIDNVSVVEVKGDKPRIDYTDSLTSPSFLLEPQSTNLITYSEDFSQSVWSKQNVTISSNSAISPDGSLNSDLLQETSANSIHYCREVLTVTSGVEFTVSFFAKKKDYDYIQYSRTVDGSSYANFNIANGTIGNNSGADILNHQIEDYGNGWYRCIANIITSSTSSGFGITLIQSDVTSRYESYLGDDSRGTYIYGAQVEQGSYATSYIPTNGSSVTRAQETCLGAGSASTFNDAEGVLYAEILPFPQDGRIALNDGTTDNNVRFTYQASNNTIFGILYNGSNQAVLTYQLPTENAFYKLAFKYKVSDFSLFVNGIKVDSLTGSGTTFTSGTLSELDFDAGNGLVPFYGKTKGIYVFNEALTDDELQQLTGPEYNSFAALAAAYNYTVI